MSKPKPTLPAFVDRADAQRRTRALCQEWHREHFGVPFAGAATLGPEALNKRARREELERKTALALRSLEELAAAIESTPNDARGFLATQLLVRAAPLRELGDGIVQPGDAERSPLEQFVTQTDRAHRDANGQGERLTDTELAKVTLLLGHWPEGAWEACKDESDVVGVVSAQIKAARARPVPPRPPGGRRG